MSDTPELNANDLYILHMWATIGVANTNILLNRWEQHQKGLDLMRAPYESHPHKVNPIQNVPTRPSDGTTQFDAFLLRMHALENDIHAGRVKPKGLES